MRRPALCLLILVLCAGRTAAAPLEFTSGGGDAWTFEKRIELRVEPGGCDRIELKAGNTRLILRAATDTVSAKLPLASGDNRVTADCLQGGQRIAQVDQTWRVRLPRPQASTGAAAISQHPPTWVRDAVVYGVVPSLFGPRGIADVTDHLPRLQALGVNTLWLSPITDAPAGDFGYAVTDHFRIRADLGDAAALKALVGAAHARGMRVILDFVPNHVSEEHPYFAETARLGRKSAYFDMFERTATGTATHYFDWKNLKNLNFDHPEVRTWIIEAFAFWVREFDVDGFRVDAAWGPRQRAPGFWPAWRTALKRLKPDLLLLAEASGRDPWYLRNGFDAAYDWTGELGRWAWQTAFDAGGQADQLRRAIAADPLPTTLRFFDNNDTGDRFITRHGPARTRLAAAMLLTLPGIPALYTGEEVGAAFRPYEEPPPLSWEDPHGLEPWFRRLIALRQSHAALKGGPVRLLDPLPGKVLAYERSGPGERILVLLNWTAQTQTVMPKTAGRRPMRDLLSGEHLAPGAVPLDAFGVRILQLQDQP